MGFKWHPPHNAIYHSLLFINHWQSHHPAALPAPGIPPWGGIDTVWRVSLLVPGVSRLGLPDIALDIPPSRGLVKQGRVCPSLWWRFRPWGQFSRIWCSFTMFSGVLCWGGKIGVLRSGAGIGGRGITGGGVTGMGSITGWNASGWWLCRF